MPHLPRRGPGRHGQPGGVAMHPGWTLTPTAVTESGPYQPEHVRETSVPASRWTSTPSPVPKSEATPVTEILAQAAAPTSVVAVSAVVPEPVAEHVPELPVAAAGPGWASEWEAVASTPTTPRAPLALHTAAVAAIDAVFGPSSAPAAWTAAPADLDPQPHPAPLPPAVLTALDLPLPPAGRHVATPLAHETARAMPVTSAPVTAVEPVPLPGAVPTPQARPAAAVVARPAPSAARPFLAAPTTRPTMPATMPPTMPPPLTAPVRATSVPSSAQQLLDRAIRTAPSAPAQHRSTVRLGFADASVIDLRPDDPIAKALHTVADALIGRTGG